MASGRHWQIGLGGFATWVATLWVAAALAPIYSGAGLFAQLPQDLRQDVPVYSVRTYDQSLTFYLRHPVTLVEYRGELDFGQTLAPGKSIATVAASSRSGATVSRRWPCWSGRRSSCCGPQGFPMVLRASSPRTYIVSRR